MPWAMGLPIGVFAVPDDLDINKVLGVVNGVQNAIIAYAQTPQALRSPEFPRAERSGVCPKLFNRRKNSTGR